jgi:hypothetical protein
MMLLMVMAIVVLGLLDDYNTRLAFAAGTLVLFATALSLTSAGSAEIIVATAGYCIPSSSSLNRS